MLEEIRITGLGVIDEAVLELGPGLTVLTGETGAGKTMVVEALALLFGGRADAALVRPGHPRALVEGRAAVGPGAIAERAAQAGAELDDGALILARSVSAEGRSRAHVGGRSVPVGVLAELAGDLVALHGQAEAHRLFRPAVQREALDRFAGPPVTATVADYRDRFTRYRSVLAELAELTERSRERAQEADLLRFGLAEIAAVAPLPGEDTVLAAEVSRLAGADGLRVAAAAAHDCLAGDPGRAAAPTDVTGLLAAARRAVDAASAADPRLAELGERLAELGYLAGDVSAEFASYAEGVEADPARLAAAQDRQAALARLVRKYADDAPADVGGVLAWAERATARLAALDGDGGRIDELTAARERLGTELTRLAGELSATRRAAADRFGGAVSAELAALAMPHAAVSVAVTGRAEFGPDGVDEVELQLAAHAGAPARPLARAASGGELSRVMLAIEVVFAGADPVPTMVFDEVDAGVGGRAAVEVGRRLARLARAHQVLAVTHLPQVAAFADRHLRVVKADDGSVTRTGVQVLDDSGRVTELSRMLAGLEESTLARGHAEELLAIAAGAKAAPEAAERA